MENIIKKSKIRFLFYGLTVIWMGVIFYLSAQNSDQSEGTSGTVIQFLLTLFDIPQTPEKIESLQGIVRTIAHFGAFGLLGFLFFCSCIFSGKCNRYFLIPLGCTFVYSVIDEIHQLFVDGRAFQFFDVMIDCAGGAVAIAFGILIFKLVISIKIKKTRKLTKALI